MKQYNQRFLIFDVAVMSIAFVVPPALSAITQSYAGMWLIGGVAANHLIGCCVCASIDDENQSLLRWVDSAPSPVIEFLTIQLWPLVVWAARRRMNGAKL